MRRVGGYAVGKKRKHGLKKKKNEVSRTHQPILQLCRLKKYIFSIFSIFSIFRFLISFSFLATVSFIPGFKIDLCLVVSVGLDGTLPVRSFHLFHASEELTDL